MDVVVTLLIVGAAFAILGAYVVRVFRRASQGQRSSCGDGCEGCVLPEVERGPTCSEMPAPPSEGRPSEGSRSPRGGGFDV